ncbi:MAG: hypothetical protein FWG84_10680 [Bacteroidales bacterium]|nr:hypothetical protein [Bacteroidales bacterium]
MKKSIFLFVMALVMSGASVTMATAQKADGSIFGKGSKVVNLGLGLGGMHGTGYGMRVPPIQGAFEIGIVDNLIKSTGQGAIGIAPTVGYAAYGFEDWTLSDIFLGVKGNFHYQFVAKLDTYAGVQFGYDVVRWSGDVTGAAGSALYYGFAVGARYYFKDKLAVMGEAGYGISWLNIGIALKL